MYRGIRAVLYADSTADTAEIMLSSYAFQALYMGPAWAIIFHYIPFASAIEFDFSLMPTKV